MSIYTYIHIFDKYGSLGIWGSCTYSLQMGIKLVMISQGFLSVTAHFIDFYIEI